MRDKKLPEVVSTHEGIGDGQEVTEVFADSEQELYPLHDVVFDDVARTKLAEFEQDAARRLTEPGKVVALRAGYKYVQRRSHRDIKAARLDILSPEWGTNLYGRDVDAAEVTLPDSIGNDHG